MIKESITIEEAISLLNEALKLDPEAIDSLVHCRVCCNPNLANHPTIQVHAGNSFYQIGILGIINGMFGTDERDWGAIAAETNDTGQIINFKRIDK